MHASLGFRKAHKIFSSVTLYKANIPEASTYWYLNMMIEVAHAIIKGHQQKCLEI